MLNALAAILAIPMLILNTLAGLVGGAWLLWLGEWKLVLAGFIIAISGPFWCSLLTLPGLLLGGPGAMAYEKGHRSAGLLLISLGSLWTYIVIAIWCLAVFWYVPQFMDRGDPILPFGLFAYATATGPWAVLTQKETQAGNGEAAQLTLSGACIGCAVVLAYVLLARRPEFATAVWLIGVPMFCFWLFSIVSAFASSRQSLGGLGVR